MKGLTPMNGLTPGIGRVVRRQRETPDTVTLWIEPPTALRPAFDGDVACGRFNMLGLPGIGEAPISISAVDGGLIAHTIRAVGRLTQGLTARGEGETLLVRGPYGRGWPVDALHGSDLLLVGGGLGLAPLRPLWQAGLKARGDVDRLTVLAGARSPTDMPFLEELQGLGRDPAIEVALTVDRGSPDWTGAIGVVTPLIERLPLRPERTQACLCGPEIMMRFAARALVEAGLPERSIHVSMERNMHCGIGRCGHCQLGPTFVCRDGPVFDYGTIAAWSEVVGA